MVENRVATFPQRREKVVYVYGKSFFFNSRSHSKNVFKMCGRGSDISIKVFFHDGILIGNMKIDKFVYADHVREKYFEIPLFFYISHF